jgi:predicted ATPase
MRFKRLKGASRYVAAGFHVIRTVRIRNFRCFEKLELHDVSRLNLIVGDNGSGKTSLLEALFLTLASSTDIPARLRQVRGLDGAFQGSPQEIEEALWGDFFYGYDMNRPVVIEIEGDGAENRTMSMGRGSSENLFALDDGGTVIDSGSTAPVVFQWIDANRVARVAVPTVSAEGLKLPTTGENLPDFFLIGTAAITSRENAGRFSNLSKRGEHLRFVETFIKEYDWLEDLNLELHANAPVIFGTLRGTHRKVPLPNISSGINRIMSILLCMARQNAVVLVDEIESGIYYSHLPAMWRAIRHFAEEYECQLIASTHSKECIDALIAVMGDKLDELSLWRTERGESGHEVRQLTGEDVHLVYELDEEIR